MLDLNEVEEWAARGGGNEGRGPRPPPRLGSMKLSRDQRMLACTIDLEGDDEFTLLVVDLEGSGVEGGERAAWPPGSGRGTSHPPFTVALV